MLLIIQPLSIVFCAIRVQVYACTLCFIIDPVALVNIAVVVDQLAPAISKAVLKLTLVFGAVKPNLSTITILFTS